MSAPEVDMVAMAGAMRKAFTERVVIYHADCVDGFTAAWVAWTVFHGDAVYVPAKYGDAPPDVTGKDVTIVDFSYPRGVLVEMAGKAKSMRVLDHHASAKRDLEGFDFCTFDMDRSGAAMAWDVLRQVTGDRRPLLVDLVQDRDLWRWRLPNSMALNAWIGIQERDFNHWTWMALRLEDESESTTTESFRIGECGQAILKHIDAYVAGAAKNARSIHVAGHDVVVVNAPGVMGSELLGALAGTWPFAVGWFQRSDGVYQYSLRSRGEVDVSKIAEKFGGGGHKGAAGFQSGLLPDELFGDESERRVPGEFAETVFAKGRTP